MRARKRFGQHFLTDEHVLELIARSIRLQPQDQLLEIGPGPGALTDYLYGQAARYLAVEIDRDLIAGLRARFPALEVVNADILSLSLPDTLQGHWRVVGNLPYNISTPLLLKLFTHLDLIQDMHFMFQRELADRLAAEPGTKDWGRLSVMTQYHCTVESLFDVAPHAFTPPPRVYSQVVRLVPRVDKPVVDMMNLQKVLRMAFSARRKRLGNALKSLELDWPQLGISAERRPDQLGLDEYVQIANALPLS